MQELILDKSEPKGLNYEIYSFLFLMVILLKHERKDTLVTKNSRYLVEKNLGFYRLLTI